MTLTPADYPNKSMEFSLMNGVKPGQFHCIMTKDNTNTVDTITLSN